MATPKTEKRSHSEVESDSSPIQEEKRREMAAIGVTNSSPIQDRFNSLAGFNLKLQSIEKTMTDLSNQLSKARHHSAAGHYNSGHYRGLDQLSRGGQVSS